mgnify:CR=1 FL=1
MIFLIDIVILIIIFAHMTDNLKHTIFNFLTTEYGNLLPYKTEECGYYVFYFLKGEKIIVYNWATKEVHIRYSIVWSFLINLFGLSDREIIILMSEWLEDRYNIKTPKIDTLNDYQFSWIKKLS